MRILALTHRLPYAPNRGDRLRAYHILQHLNRHAEVELVSLVHDRDEASHLDDARAIVSRVHGVAVSSLTSTMRAGLALLGSTPLTHAMLDSRDMPAVLREICAERRPDVVFAYCSGMARFAMQPPLDRIPFVLDFVDVDSRKWRDLAAASGAPKSWIYRREATTLGAFEARAARAAAVSLVVNDREAANARALAPSADVRVLPNGVELDRLRPAGPPSASKRVVFCGVMSYAPNADGVTWFIDKVWPLVKTARTEATLAIVGMDPSPAMRSHAERDSSITVTGRVPDVRSWLWESAVGIAPLHVARGLQNKALEAIAAGLPIVITDAVAGGLPQAARRAARIANTPEAFASEVISLLDKSAEERRAMAAAADFSELLWQRTLAPLLPIMKTAAVTPRHAPSIGTLHSSTVARNS